MRHHIPHFSPLLDLFEDIMTDSMKSEEQILSMCFHITDMKECLKGVFLKLGSFVAHSRASALEILS